MSSGPPASASAPGPRRIAVAALAAGAVAATQVSLKGPAVAHVALMPVLVASSAWLFGHLLRRLPPSLAATCTAATVAVPAGTLRHWVGISAVDLASTIEPSGALHGVLTEGRRASEELAPVLFAAALAVVLLWGRRGAAAAGALLGGAAGAAAARAGLLASLEALEAGEYAAAALWSRGVPWAAGLAPVGLALGLGLQRPRLRAAAVLPLALTVALAAWGAHPPLRAIQSSLRAPPAALPGMPLPEGPLGTPVAAAAFTLEDLPEPAAHLVEPPPPWPCQRGEEQWRTRPRLTAAVGLPPEAGLAELDAAIASLAGGGTHRLALVGRAAAPPGPLSDWLGWPAAAMLLDRPPHTTRWARLGPDGLAWEGPAPAPGDRAPCGLLPQTGLTIQQLYDTLRALQDDRRTARCAAVAVVPRWWRPTAPARPLAALSCAAEIR